MSPHLQAQHQQKQACGWRALEELLDLPSPLRRPRYWVPAIFLYTLGYELYLAVIFTGSFSSLIGLCFTRRWFGTIQLPFWIFEGSTGFGGTNLGVPLLICCTTALCYVAVNPGNPSLDPLNVMCRGETLVPRLGTGRGCFPPLQEGK